MDRTRGKIVKVQSCQLRAEISFSDLACNVKKIVVLIPKEPNEETMGKVFATRCGQWQLLLLLRSPLLFLGKGLGKRTWALARFCHYLCGPGKSTTLIKMLSV